MSNGLAGSRFDPWLLAMGIVLLTGSSFAAAYIGRNMEHEGRRAEAAGWTLALMVANLLQLAGVIFVLISIFG